MKRNIEKELSDSRIEILCLQKEKAQKDIEIARILAENENLFQVWVSHVLKQDCIKIECKAQEITWLKSKPIRHWEIYVKFPGERSKRVNCVTRKNNPIVEKLTHNICESEVTYIWLNHTKITGWRIRKNLDLIWCKFMFSYLGWE